MTGTDEGMETNSTVDRGAAEIGRHVLIVRYGEVALKGMNKPWFERVLLSRIRKALQDLPNFEELKIDRSDGLIIVSGAFSSSAPLVKRIAKVFGVASVSPAIAITDRRLESISAAAVSYMTSILAEREANTGGMAVETSAAAEDGERADTLPLSFKIFGKRSDKTWPITSPEMSARVGAAVLKALGDRVRVDVRDPAVRLNIHLRLREVFLYDEKINTIGGLPLGMGGKGMVLLSGGIDSPTAAWLMAKRGMSVEAIHFHSYPYTSPRARQKVEELAEILAGYCGRFRLHAINLLPAQEAIAAHCPEGMMTLLVRRFMMRLAERIARQENCLMLVTGENLGQVASQTAEALVVTDAVCTMPVMRPLIAMDKIDIMDLARDIGTYEKSIEPYEDCCTVFLPKHPDTRPSLEAVETAEAAIPDMEGLLDRLFAARETRRIG
jgi:thiamine biosynthesis protein ThiI